MKICIKCGNKVDNDVSTCESCNASLFRPIIIEKQEDEQEKQNLSQYNTIGGWLIFIGIGRALAPLFTILSILSYNPLAFYSYTTVIKSYINFKILSQIVFLMLDIVLINLFLKRKKSFPKAMIWFSILTLVYAILNYVVVASLGLGNIINNSSSQRNIVMTIASYSIWIPYLLTSKRVKETFINQ